MNLILILVAVVGISNFAEARLCRNWSSPESVGQLDSGLLPEASGLAVSAQFSNRLYHVNDRGNKPAIIVTDEQGQTIEQVGIKGFTPEDSEELALGPCGQATCLFIGDIGDNDRSRSSVTVAWLREVQNWGSSAQIQGRIQLQYPEGPQNAEAMVVHPETGDLFIFTKGMETKGRKSGGPSVVYKATGQMLKAQKDAILQKVGQIDVTAILPDQKSKDQLVTAASVHTDGQSLMLLTYRNAIQFAWDFKSKLNVSQEGKDYQVLELDGLKKQEAVSFIPETRSFLVTTESKKKDGLILRLDCNQ